MPIDIQRGISSNHRIPIAKIFFESFEGILGQIMGNSRKATKLISKLIREERILAALNGTRVVGFAGLNYQGKRFMKFNFTEIARVYGLATIRVLLFFLIDLFDKNLPHQLHLEVLAVEKSQRSQGTGTKLLLSTIDFARKKGFKQIRLQVKNTNPKAKKLYENIGFKTANDRKIPCPFNIFTGFSIITEMHYNIWDSKPGFAEQEGG